MADDMGYGTNLTSIARWRLRTDWERVLVQAWTVFDWKAVDVAMFREMIDVGARAMLAWEAANVRAADRWTEKQIRALLGRVVEELARSYGLTTLEVVHAR